MRFPNPVRSSFASGALRRAFHTYWRFSRGLTMGVRGVVLDEQEPGLPDPAHLCARLASAGRRGRDRRDHRRGPAARTARGGLHPDRGRACHPWGLLQSGASKRDHVVVYVVRGLHGHRREAARPGNRRGGFLPAGLPPGERRPRRPVAGSRRSSRARAGFRHW